MIHLYFSVVPKCDKFMWKWQKICNNSSNLNLIISPRSIKQKLALADDVGLFKFVLIKSKVTNKSI